MGKRLFVASRHAIVRHTTKTVNKPDTIIIGAGFGGLATALLLADRGRSVMVLEAHTMTGGCAGAFERFERVGERSERRFETYRFDAGATTLSGLHPDGPFDRLFTLVGERPPVRQIDPGIISHLDDGTLLHRYADLDRWIAESSRVFGAKGQDRFWREIDRIAAACWHLAMTNRRFPPHSAADLISLVRPSNLRALPLLPHLRSSVADLLRRHGLDRNERFSRFINEQLLITAQNHAEEVPLLVGAMGLNYPGDTWYPEGGMYGIAEWMEEKIVERGGEIRTKHRVEKIVREDDRWRVETSRGDFSANTVVANLTLWDVERLLEGEDRTIEREIERLPETWGALCYTAAISSEVGDHGSLYHQVAIESHPLIDSSSIFISLSPSDDRRRAPEGYRTISVSTHVANPGAWIALKQADPDAYELKKRAFLDHILPAMERALPGFREHADVRRHEHVATPASFHTFTRRHNGTVGGVPFRSDRSLFTLPGPDTSHKNLYLVGDTVYPGQGAPAVVIGAMNAVGRI